MKDRPSSRIDLSANLFSLHPDPRLLAIQNEIAEVEARLRELERQALLHSFKDVLRGLCGFHTCELEITKQRLKLRLADLHAQLDPNYARRLASTRRRVEQMHKAMDLIAPPDERGSLSDILKRLLGS